MDQNRRLLSGKVLAVTGRLVSMSRHEAVTRIEQAKGRFVRRVSRLTDVLVVGQAGWPMRLDGRPT